MLTLGIDPGKRGALVFIDPGSCRIFSAHSMPLTSDNDIDADCLVQILSRHVIKEAWIEDVHAGIFRPRYDESGNPQKMGAVSAFTFGEGKGILTGALAALKVPRNYVSPQKWKGSLRCTADKKQTKARARFLFRHDLALLTNEGKHEAALIALYGVLSRK